MLGQSRCKSSDHQFAELFDEINILNVYDFYTAELFKCFLNQLLMFYQLISSLYEREISNVQTRKTKLSLLSFLNESCSVSRNFLRYGVCEGNQFLIRNKFGYR